MTVQNFFLWSSSYIAHIWINMKWAFKKKKKKRREGEWSFSSHVEQTPINTEWVCSSLVQLPPTASWKTWSILSSLFPPMSFKIRNNTNLRRAWLVEQLATVSVVVVIMVVVTSPCKSCKSSCGRGCYTHAVGFHCYFSLRLNSFRFETSILFEILR